MTNSTDQHHQDPLDDRLGSLFAAAADMVPASEALLAGVMAQLAARERSRRRVLRSALLLGALLALGSAWLMGSSWLALLDGLGGWLGGLPSARELAGGLDLMGSTAMVAVTPLVLLLLWPLLADARPN
jgi:hypothetical protein